MSDAWLPGDSPAEEALRREAYRRLLAAAHRAGLPLEQLARMLREVAHNEAETRRFLSEQVYAAPDDMLDDLIRIRMEELERRQD
jgi:hypothetical protein